MFVTRFVVAVYLVLAVTASAGNGLELGSTDLSSSSFTETIFESILEFSNRNLELVLRSIDYFFKGIGIREGTPEWNLVEKLKETLQREEISDIDDEDVFTNYLIDISEKNITIPPKFKNQTIPCKLCLGIVALLRVVVKNVSYSTVEPFAIEVCHKVLKPRGFRVDELCDGTVKLMGPHVYKIMSYDTPIPGPPLFLLKICPYMNACASSSSSDGSNVAASGQLISSENGVEKIARKVNKKLFKNGERKLLKLAQVSDIHMEPRYQEGTAVECGLPVCCIEKWGSGHAGLFGDYNCNVPTRTIENFLQKIKSFNPDVIFFTGDVSPHTLWEETYESQTNCTKITANLFRENLPGYKIYPVIGNHETYPTNLFSTKELEDTKKFLKLFKESWTDVANFSKEDEKNVEKGGYYTRLVLPGLRVVVFNSDYMYTHNYYNVFNHEKFPREAKDTQTFVETSLKNAKSKHEKVILLFHHPPGGSDFIISESVWLEKVVLAYTDTIVLIANGHTHHDEFRIVYDKIGQPASVMLVSPSMTTKSMRNPTMRIYYLDESTYELVDYEQYYLDIAGLAGLKVEDLVNYDITKHIKLLYSAKEEYGLEDMSPLSWNKLIERMENDKSLALKHMNNYNALAETVSSVNSNERQAYLCQLKNIHYDSYKTCVKTKPPKTTRAPIKFSKRPPLPEPDIGGGSGQALRSSWTLIAIAIIFFNFYLQ